MISYLEFRSRLHDLGAEGHDRQLSEFDELESEGDPDDRYTPDQADQESRARELPSEEDDPDQIHDETSDPSGEFDRASKRP